MNWKNIKYDIFSLICRNNYKKVLKRISHKKILRVIFLVTENSKWGYQSLYEEMEKSDRFSPLIVVSILDGVHKGKDTTRNNLEENYSSKVDIYVVSDMVKKELIKNAILSLIISLIGIIIYVSIRFKFNYAISGIIALLHDILITIIFFGIFKLEIDSVSITSNISEDLAIDIDNTINENLPQIKEEKHSSQYNPPKHVKVDRKERQKMPGYKCELCQQFYETLDENPELLCEECSRHRTDQNQSSTPKGFYDISI